MRTAALELPVVDPMKRAAVAVQSFNPTLSRVLHTAVRDRVPGGQRFLGDVGDHTDHGGAVVGPSLV
jgi:hypothetical protein